MEKTTIAITKEAKEEMQVFGNKGETYSDIIMKLVESAKQRQLHDLLFNEEDSIPIEVVNDSIPSGIMSDSIPINVVKDSIISNK